MPTKREDDANHWKARKSKRPTPVAQPGPAGSTPKSGIHPTAELLPCEDRTAHDALIARYYDRLRPTKPEECCYVDEIVYCEWTLRRLRRADTELNLFVHEECFETNENYPVGQPAADNPKVFSALQWRFNSTRRALKNAIDALRDLRVNPIPDSFPEPPAAPEITPPTDTNQTTSLGIGFVPNTPSYASYERPPIRAEDQRNVACLPEAAFPAARPGDSRWLADPAQQTPLHRGYWTAMVTPLCDVTPPTLNRIGTAGPGVTPSGTTALT